MTNTNTEALAAYNVDDARVTEVAAMYSALVVDGAKDKEGLVIAHDAKIVVRDMLSDIESTRKMLKADSIAFGKAVDGRAKELSAPLLPVKAHLQAQEDAVKKEKEEAKARALALRAAILTERCDKLRSLGAEFSATALDNMTGPEFAELLDAETAQHAERERADLEERERVEAEEEAKAEEQRLQDAARKAEEASLAKEAKRLDELSAKLAADQKKIDDDKAETARVAQAVEDEKARILRDEEIAKKAAANERKRLKAQEELATKAAEAKAARMPLEKRVDAFAQQVADLPIPEGLTTAAWEEIFAALALACKTIQDSKEYL